MDHNLHVQQRGFDWYRIGLWVAIGTLGYFLFTEHRAHTFYFLPFIFLLACPLMHIFMHGGHRQGDGNSKEKK